MMNYQIRPVIGCDADVLFPGIFQTSVTETIQWDGPRNLDEYRAALEEKERLHKEGEVHFFTIVDLKTQTPVGSMNIRPDGESQANIGLWVSPAHQGKGAGTKAVAEAVKYSFEILQIKKLEAYVFVGNGASRRIFEKNGFVLERTLRGAVRKRGLFLDEWVLVIQRPFA